MEPSCSHTADSPAKPKATCFFPLRKLKGIQPTKTPAVQLSYLEEEAPDDEEGIDGKYYDGLEGVTEEFMVCLARAVKDAQPYENAVITAVAQTISSGIVCW